MSESTFKIRERTVILFGPVNSIVQTLATVLQEHGADIAFLDQRASESQRFVANLMDMRQIHNTYGRAAAIDCDIKSPADAKEALSRAAELFGSVDILIDANFGQYDLSVDKNPTQLITDEAIEFFVGRGKGRNIYLTYDDVILKHVKDDKKIKNNKKLLEFAVSKSHELSNKQITTNVISLPFTDEFMLNYYKNKKIQEAMNEISKDWPEARLVQPIDIAYTVAFLASPISVAIDGQWIHACYGLNN
ncbi:MAG: SDR family oxidoreductase [Bdellovibrionales bacterium]|nr:SDR family oxidoreductase [Bdellovibrionales bacterium]